MANDNESVRRRTDRTVGKAKEFKVKDKTKEAGSLNRFLVVTFLNCLISSWSIKSCRTFVVDQKFLIFETIS